MKSQSKEQEEGSEITPNSAQNCTLCSTTTDFTIALTFPDPMLGAELSAVHDGRESCTLFTGCQDLQLPTLLHKTTATSMHFLIFFIYHCCSECWGEDRKLGIGLLPAPPLLPNFGGNGNFHILAEIENIKSGSGGEYLLYMHQRVMQFRKLSKYWLCTLWNDTPILKQDAH